MVHQILLVLFVVAVVVVIVEIRRSNRRVETMVESRSEPQSPPSVASRSRRALLIGQPAALANVAFNLKLVDRYDVVETVDGSEAIPRLAALIDPSADVVAVVDSTPEGLAALDIASAVRSQPDLAAVRMIVLLPTGEGDAPPGGSHWRDVQFLVKPFSTETLLGRLRAVTP